MSYWFTTIKTQIAKKHSNKLKKIYLLMQPKNGKKFSVSDQNENNKKLNERIFVSKVQQASNIFCTDRIFHQIFLFLNHLQLYETACRFCVSYKKNDPYVTKHYKLAVAHVYFFSTTTRTIFCYESS